MTPQVKLPALKKIAAGPKAALVEIESSLQATQASIEGSLPVPKLPKISLPKGPGAGLSQLQEFLKPPTEIAEAVEPKVPATPEIPPTKTAHEVINRRGM